MSVSKQYALPPSPPTPPTPPATKRTFVHVIGLIVPPWLTRRVAAAVLGAIAEQVDDLEDRARAAVKLRFPGFYSMESLPLIGRERRIRRGRFETEATYASRLMPWLDHHRRRGGPYAMLAQLFAYYAPNNFEITLWYLSGRNFAMDTAGVITRGDDATFTQPGPAEKWARWWLYFEWPDPVDDDGLWSDPGTYDDGGVWDSNLSPDDVRDIRLIPREWQSAVGIGRIRLISPLKTIEFSVD